MRNKSSINSTGKVIPNAEIPATENIFIKKIDFLVRQISEICGNCCSFYIRMEKEEKNISITSFYNPNPLSFPQKDSFIEEIFKQTAAATPHEPAYFHQVCQDSETLYFLCFPVLLKDTIVGSFGVMDKITRDYSALEVKTISAFAMMISFEEDQRFSDKESKETRSWLYNIPTADRDISERKKPGNTLSEGEKQYRLLVENASDAIFIIQDNLVKFFNPKTLEMTGYSPEELSDLPFHQLLHPKDQQPVTERFKHILNGDKLPNLLSCRIINKKGDELWGQLNSVIFQWGDKPSILNFLRDITPQKKMETQFFYAQRIDSIGTLAGGIAHDFNNLLMGIQGRISLMLTSTEDSNPNFEHLVGIEEYVQNASDLCKHLLSFAKGGSFETKPTNLNSLIQEQCQMFGRTKKEIRIYGKYDETPWTVDVDQAQIKQVLLNLLVNAWQAMPAGGDIYIHTENIIIDDQYDEPLPVKPGKYVKASITDTGIGMDEETRKRVFDPFFTTKDKTRGTGLGLASAYIIIKNHNGFIDVHSELGLGSTFFIYLPASEAKVVSNPHDTPHVLLMGTETILLVDDEEMILYVSTLMLKKLGYKVLTADSGHKALETYRNKMESISLIILDMIMPEMSGTVTFDKLKEINPYARILLSSGYTLDGEAAEIMKRGCSGFIQKPINLRVLSQKLREILDNPDS